MLTQPDTLSAATQSWLESFETALASETADGLDELFHDTCFWRDVLALTWRIKTENDRSCILAELHDTARRQRMRGLTLDHDRQEPKLVNRAGETVIEAIFSFKTKVGSGWGLVRLIDTAGDGTRWQAWTLFTGLDSIAFDGTGGDENTDHARDFRGPNWLDNRKAARAYDGRDPAVLVVGGGQAGLSIAARLTAMNVDTLIVDRAERIGDNWRKRYHALTLHNQTHVNHLPFMPFPPTWPVYIPKDKLAGWFEAYVEAMELNFWTGTEFAGATYDETAGHWTATLRSGSGATRTMHPRHIVMATGVSGIANRPDMPTLADFAGTVLHSSEYTDGEDWSGRRAIVIGTGNSGHDIAQDLHSGGADVTLVQRSPTLIVNLEPSAQLPYALYGEGVPCEDCDLITVSMPTALARKNHQRFTDEARRMDKPLLDALRARGFKLDFGEDDTGWQFKYLTRGGGYYFNVGCSDLVAAGDIRLEQWDAIKGFGPDGARLKDGSTLDADLIVLSTGYKGQEYLVRKLFGDAVAAKVGPIWGFGEGDELRNMYVRTGQPGLWFIAGSLAQCRIYSHYLGLQLKASELGLIDS